MCEICNRIPCVRADDLSSTPSLNFPVTKHGKWEVWFDGLSVCVGDHFQIGFGLIALLVWAAYWLVKHAH